VTGKLSAKWLTLAFLASLFIPFGRAPAQQPTEQNAKVDPLYHGLDNGAVLRAQIALQLTLEKSSSHNTRRWRDTASGSSGTITPLRTFRIKTGHYCREYRERISSVDRVVAVTRVACRDTDGVWQLAGR
jgi:surface antigen